MAENVVSSAGKDGGQRRFCWCTPLKRRSSCRRQVS